MTAQREHSTQDCAYPPHPEPAARQDDDGDGQPGAGRPSGKPGRRPVSGLRAWVRHAPAERVPLLAVPAVWTAAEIMHAAGVAGYDPGLATVVAASIAYGTGERRARRSAHPALEGAALAAAIGVPGAWLTAATITGPLWGRFDLMTTVFYSAVTVGGYGWLRRRDAVRAARARRDAAAEQAARLAAEAAAWLVKKAEWHRLAPKVGLQGSDLLQAQENQNDSETWLIDTYGAGRQLASQVHCRTVAQKLSGEKLQMAGWHAVPMNRIEVTPDADMAYHLLITFRRSDLWKGGTDQGLNWHPVASGELDHDSPYAGYFGPAPSILDPVDLGANPETGEPMLLTLYDEYGGRRVLVLGTSGSGKSMILDTIRERVTACHDAIVLQINLSKGVEDSWWEPLTAASALASVHGEEAEARALRILDFIHGVVNTGRPRPPGQRTHKPTPDEPAIVLIIDEVDTTASDADRKDQLGRIASKCRSEGIVLIEGSQRPQDVYVGGGMVRSNLTDLVWGALRATDLRQAGGSYGTEIPDMAGYGGGLPGAFGIAPLPLAEGRPVFKGRGFFWGKDSAGLIAIINERLAARGGRRPYQVLEPGLAARFGAAWAEITGNATQATQATQASRAAQAGDLASRGQDGRYDIKRARDGSTVPSGAGVQRKLDAARAVIDGDLPDQLRARMQAGTPDAARQEEKRQALAADPLPAAEQAQLWQLVSPPGGISGREAARLLQRAQPAGRRATWSHTTVINQLRVWESDGKVERTGSGRSDTRWHALAPGAVPKAVPVPYLHAVPDRGGQAPAGPPGTAAAHTAGPGHDPDQDDPGRVLEDGQVLGPGQFTTQQAAVMVAFWALQNGTEHAIETARRSGMADAVLVYALHLAEEEAGYVKAEARRILLEGGAPVPAWLGEDAGEPPGGHRGVAR
jgi:hypothetical protein